MSLLTLVSTQRVVTSSIYANYFVGDGSLLTNVVGSGITSNQFFSTVEGLGSIGYASTSFVAAAISSFSTAFGPGGGGANMDVITSTVEGLGSAGYVSTANLLGLVSTQNLVGLLSTSFLDTQLASTVAGLGTAEYISSLSLISTTQAFLTAGYLVSANLQSTVEGLGTAGYASTSFVAAAISSFSTAFGPGGVDMAMITSTVAGLGTAGYVSSPISSFFTLSTGSITLSTTTFLDPSDGNAPNNVYVNTKFLYFNDYISGETKVAQPQVFTF